MIDAKENPTSGLGTRAVWSGEQGEKWHGTTQVPVALSVSYGYETVEEWLDVALGRKPGHIYGRNTNPTVAVFEEKIRDLEGAEAATSFASGMAAISNTLFTLLSPGDRMVSIKDTYGGTNKIFIEFLPRFEIEVDLCDTTDHVAIEAAIARGCKLVYLETPTNPTIRIVDIARLARAAHERGAVVAVDNTFATPINQRPLELGADLVIHSATKFLGGHADALGGVVCGTRDLVSHIYHFREINGACLEPMSAYLLLRGMKTLHLRIRQQNENAMKIAEFLASHSRVAKDLPAAGYDWALPLYDPIVQLLGGDKARRILLDQAELQPGCRLLDVGCGTGTLAILSKRLYPDVGIVGIDPDPKALGRARRKASRAAVSIQFDQGFGDELPYPEASFDRVSRHLCSTIWRAPRRARRREQCGGC
jgi:cystathionine gamma-synthase